MGAIIAILGRFTDDVKGLLSGIKEAIDNMINTLKRNLYLLTPETTKK